MTRSSDGSKQHREVDRLYGGYWDVYRLSFLTGGRVKGVPVGTLSEPIPRPDWPVHPPYLVARGTAGRRGDPASGDGRRRASESVPGRRVGWSSPGLDTMVLIASGRREAPLSSPSVRMKGGQGAHAPRSPGPDPALDPGRRGREPVEPCLAKARRRSPPRSGRRPGAPGDAATSRPWPSGRSPFLSSFARLGLSPQGPLLLRHHRDQLPLSRLPGP